MALKSSRFQVFPIEKDPFGFSRALFTVTLPDLRTANIMTLFFLLLGSEFGGGGVDGYRASSDMRTCVIYCSRKVPLLSFFEKQLSMSLLFSSSNLAARAFIASGEFSALVFRRGSAPFGL